MTNDECCTDQKGVGLSTVSVSVLGLILVSVVMTGGMECPCFEYIKWLQLLFLEMVYLPWPSSRTVQLIHGTNICPARSGR